MPLTDTACKNAKPTDNNKARKMADGHGLYLEVMPSGARYWRLKYRFMEKEKRLALGVYPDVTLGQARQKGEGARKLLANGVDPSFAKKEQKRQATLNAENTFAAIAREWHEKNLVRWSDRHGETIIHRLEVDIFPLIGHRPIKEISAPELLDTLRKIEKRGAIEMSHRSMQTCGQVFRYGVATGRAERNPAADLKGALKPVKHDHYASLDPQDLPAFLQALERNDARLYAHTRLAIRLMMLTFVRTGELIAAKWNEIDLEKGQWMIPAERMKMRKTHIVPLTPQTIALFRDLKALAGDRDFVFPSQINSKKHMSNNTILKALERMGYKGQMTGHGFRALAMSTIKEKLGYRHEVVDRQLAHAPRNKVDAAYDRAQFLEERGKMMQDWADYLTAMTDQEKIVVGSFRQVGFGS